LDLLSVTGFDTLFLWDFLETRARRSVWPWAPFFLEATREQSFQSTAPDHRENIMPVPPGYYIGQTATWTGDSSLVSDGYFPTGTGKITALMDAYLQITWDSVSGNTYSGQAVSTFTYDDPGLSAVALSPSSPD
jgi:hypothetical protein